MHKRLLAVVILAFSLILALTWGASAQGPEPSSHDWAMPSPEPTMPDGPASPRGPNAAAVAVGQPGTVFRYLQTFGITEQAYPNPGTTYLNSPSGLFIDGSDNLYVVEDHGYRVLRYNSSGISTLTPLGTAGLCIDRNNPTQFCIPQDVAADGGGNMWVATDSRIAEFDTNGVFIQQLPTPNSSGGWSSGSDNTHFNSANGVAFDHIGHMFVSDSNNQRIEVYSFSGNSPVYSTTIGMTGVATATNAGFNFPHRLAVDSGNRIYVTDSNNDRIQRCAFSGTWVCATFANGMSSPQGITADSSDNIYIRDTGNGRLVKCNSGGTCASLINSLSYGLDVAVDSGGNIYLGSYGHGVVQKYNSGGSFTSNFVGVPDVSYITDTVRIYSPWGIAVTSDGSIYVTEFKGYRLLKLNAAGTQQWAVGSAGVFGGFFGTLEGKPAVTGDGRVIVADTSNNRIQIFNTNGVYLSTFGSFGASGNDKFNWPTGVFINPLNGDIYIADRNNHRVQVYDTNLVYKATLGVTGISGSDAAHFNLPRDVTLDASGNIYVADFRNNRVQKCIINGINYTCATFAGVVTVAGSDFDHFNRPTAIQVDGAGRVYVADESNNRVQVFDTSGAYLTTVGGSWGNLSGQLRAPSGVAIDTTGNLYVADRENHRIQKFAPGVPGWKQSNINGFGDRENSQVTTLGVFNNQLYAGLRNTTSGAQLWRTSDGTHWTSIITSGFGITRNIGLRHLLAFHGLLYVGTQADNTNGGELWRSGDGLNWTRVVSQGFGDPTNNEVFHLTEFGSLLYASTNSSTAVHGAEIWRSGDGLSWTRVVSNGFGDSSNATVPVMAVFNGNLYASANNPAGAELWRSSTGAEGSWIPTNAGGFGEGATNGTIHGLAAFNNMLYATTGDQGGQIWRSPDGAAWTKIVTAGFGNPNNVSIEGLIAIGGALYITTNNGQTGMQVWRSTDGVNWIQISPDGFGDSNNPFGQRSDDVAEFNGRFVTGTSNFASGAEIWQMLQQTFLPSVMR